ncbi:inhibitor of growth protein 3-like [Thrips palmi]|uniref:Inhibitor of growth protein n=1 Tax=Thrips palmi TaxID=161013 RepID=A0A6P8YY42_THRPL|nr:inhibitor of growth protein 3-like [Thrips palmi]
MLYLEDYLEMIEHLPQELRDRFTDMREMDLGVQNSIDGLEKKVKGFFANAKRLPKLERDAENDCIRKEYYKTLEDADEKVQLASQMYELVDRYLRRLDAELFKFKIELEADNAGITEVLEKRSLELDAPPPSSREKENRYSFGSRASNTHGKQKKRRDSSAVGSVGVGGSSDSRSSSHSSLQHGHRDHHGQGHRESHSNHAHRDSHAHHAHRDGHAGHRDGLGVHRDSHGGHRDAGHREGHAGHRDGHAGHASHRDGHAHRESREGRDGHHRDHSVHRDHGHLVHRDHGHGQGHAQVAHRERDHSAYRESQATMQAQAQGGHTYGLSAGMAHKDRDRSRDPSRDRDRERGGGGHFAQSHQHAQQLHGLGHGVLERDASPATSTSSGSRHQDRHQDRLPDRHQDRHQDRLQDRLQDAHGVPYGLGHMGAGGTAIAAAASQAIAATQQIERSAQGDTKEMQQGRRTASLKASYEAIGGSHSHDFAIGREIAGAAQTALAAIHDIPKKKKKSNASNSHALSSSSSGLGSSLSSQQGSSSASLSNDLLPLAGDAGDDGLMDPNGDGLGDGDNPDWTYDPNEPRYCLCNQVSYGDMVACDNEDCPFEWFHYACVNITAPPKGKWYCPQCSSSMKRRRKN